MASKTTPKPKESVWAEISFKDVKGQTLQGQIPLTCAPGIYKSPDLEKLKTEKVDWFKDWLIESGFTLQGDQGEALWKRAYDMYSMAALMAPDLPPTSPKLPVLVYFLAMADLKDDLPEMKNVIAKQKDKALQIGLIGGEILTGKFKSMDDLPPVYPEIAPVLKSLLLASAKAREIIPDFLANCKNFVRTTDESFIGLAIAALDYIMPDEERLPEDSFIYLHKFSCGVESFFELATLLVGITLPDSMRTNILFRRVMELATMILGTSKDLFMIRPDAAKDYGMNRIIVKSKAQKIPLKQAFDGVIRELNDYTVNFIAGCERLRILYPKNKRLDKFLSVIEKLLDGHMYFQATNKKYGGVDVKFTQKQGAAGASKPLQSDAVRSSDIDAKKTWK
jgi:hypothetical protein